MTIYELKEILKAYPDNLEAVIEAYGTYYVLNEKELHIVKGVPKSGWVMISHSKLSQEDKNSEKEYLCFTEL